MFLPQEQPDYRGSVQDLWYPTKPTSSDFGHGISLLTGLASIYDFGHMFPPEKPLKWKHIACTIMRDALYRALADPKGWQELKHTGGWRFVPEKMKEGLRDLLGLLQEEGLKTHHIEMVRIESVEPTYATYFHVTNVVKPVPQKTVDGRLCYDYLRDMPGHFLVGLEWIFRFGLPEGSSVFRQLKRAQDQGRRETVERVLQELGLSEMPKIWQELPFLNLNFDTKFELHDRRLSYQEAVLISRLPVSELNRLVCLNVLLAVFLREWFAKRGLVLWDGKAEWISTGHLADTLDLDSLRLSVYIDGAWVHLSKEMLRQEFENTPWHDEVELCQKLAEERGITNWKEEIYLKERGNPRYPEINPSFQQIFDTMHASTVSRLTGHPDLSGAPPLEEVAREYIKYRASRKR